MGVSTVSRAINNHPDINPKTREQIQQVNFEEDEVAVALELIKEKRLKGIIFLGCNYYHPEGLMEKINVPFVLSTVGEISEDEKLQKYSHVTVNDMKESYKATEYLIKKDIATLLLFRRRRKILL